MNSFGNLDKNNNFHHKGNHHYKQVKKKIFSLELIRNNFIIIIIIKYNMPNLRFLFQNSFLAVKIISIFVKSSFLN